MPIKGGLAMGDKLKEKELLEYFLNKMGLDTPFMIHQAFLGYQFQKSKGKNSEMDDTLPTKLIKMYYSLNIGEVEFDNLRKNFRSRYVQNESKLEGVHGKEEIKGLKAVYDYLHSEEISEYFSIYSLKDIHRKLYSYTPHSEAGGEYRKIDVYLPNTGINLCSWDLIPSELHRLSPNVDNLHTIAQEIRATGDVDLLLEFLDHCVDLKCDLIKIHPFVDGNGRTIRAFTNKLLEDAGLPAIYIKANEREKYEKAMQLAIGEENDRRMIKTFYRYKVCDSIVELDIKHRINPKNIEQTGSSQFQKKISISFDDYDI